MTEYSIKSYVDDNGKEPIKDWLKSLDGTTRKRILLRFDRLRDGNFGDYKQLDNDLYEHQDQFKTNSKIKIEEAFIGTEEAPGIATYNNCYIKKYYLKKPTYPESF